jgi:1,4-dihydroxy-2-naphthoate octaprenyltransferase
MESTRPAPALVWLRGMRAPFFSASVVPVLVGGAAAYFATRLFHWGYFLVTLLGMVALHAAANMINDYFDYKSGCDPNNPARTVFNGGSNVITDGLMTERTMRVGIVVAYAIGIACGLFLAAAMGAQGWVVVLLGVVGVAISYTYTAPRLLLAGRGVGEVGIALCFGLLAVQGTAFVQAGAFTWTGLFASVPVAGLIVAILWINQFPDVPADHAVGKDNAVVRLGPKRARWGYYGLLAITYLALPAGIAIAALPWWSLLALGGLPLALRAARILHTHYNEPGALLPAQAATIQAHLLTGVLLAVGLLLGGLL